MSPGMALSRAMIGTIMIVIGVVAIAAAVSARPRRDRTAFYFGVIAMLYGVRLEARSELIRTMAPSLDAMFDYIATFVTYSILVPVSLFAESLVGPGWHRLVRRSTELAWAYAIAAIAIDVAARRPEAGMWLNAPVLLVVIAVQFPHIVRLAGGWRWSAELRAVAITLAIFTGVVLYETVTRRRIFGGVPEAEPLAMLLFTGALGWFVFSRTREQSYAYAALSRELQLARDIQQSLLPRQMPTVAGLRLEGAYLPMNTVAGDFYDVLVLPDGRVLLIVADVSGHGIPAALVASMVKIAFAAEADRYVLPGDILGGLNRALTGKFERAYVTACCALIDARNDVVSYASAGHPPALVRRQDGRIERLDVGGIALTWQAQVAYETTDTPLRPGDRLLMFTDGLLEATTPGGDEFFGDAALDRAIAESPPGASLSGAVLRAHREWLGAETPLSDDVTLVVVERT